MIPTHPGRMFPEAGDIWIELSPGRSKTPNSLRSVINNCLKPIWCCCLVFCRKYGLKIMIDLHAVPGSCNGWDLGGSRDGSTLWPLKENVDKTLEVITILSQRFDSLTKNSINEPSVMQDMQVRPSPSSTRHSVIERASILC